MKQATSRRHLLKQSAVAMMLSGRSLSAQTRPEVPSLTRQDLQALIGGYQTSQMLHVAAKLKIADALEDGPRTTTELAKSAGAHEDSLYRLLRTLASLGIFTELDGRRFQLNPAAESLRSDAQGSVRVFAEILGEEWMWRPWGALFESVRTGQTAFNHVYGTGERSIGSRSILRLAACSTRDKPAPPRRRPRR